jgi:hypothetical protein
MRIRRAEAALRNSQYIDRSAIACAAAPFEIGFFR